MHETTDATAIFAPLWRRKWLILGVGILVAVASYLYYRRATPTYSASTQVYLGASAEEAAPGEKAGKHNGAEVGNQADVINDIVVEDVRRQLRKEHKSRLMRAVKVKAKSTEKGEFITISAEGHPARATTASVNRVAQAYINRRDLDRERGIERSIALTRRQLHRLEATQAPVGGSASSKGKSSSTADVLQETALNNKIDRLEGELVASGAEQVKPATRAALLAPVPKKDAIFGFVIGIVLASIAAYALGRLDRRLRSLEAIESIFRTQILTALPKVARPVIRVDGQAAPSRLLLEPLRRLHTTLWLGAGSATSSSNGAARANGRRTTLALGTGSATSSGNGARHETGRTILFLSPDAGDGKSALIANLALVQRDAGARVAIVEANFRRPIQSRLLGLSPSHGLAEVLAGTVSIDDAMQQPTPMMPAAGDAEPTPHASAPGLATAVATRHRTGSLLLLAGSTAVANPPALLGDGAIAGVLRSLAESCDYVLVDAPSPLEVSDVMPLLRVVDGIVIVARAGHTREPSAQRFTQLLARSSAATVLGVVANCVSERDISRHGLSTLSSRTWLGKLIGS